MINTDAVGSFRLRAARSLNRHAPLIVLLPLMAFMYLCWSWGAGIGQLGGDGPSYLMMANHYAHGIAADPVYANMATYSRFPPLYPLVLSWCHAADDLRLVHMVGSICLILAVLFYYAWLFLEGMSPAQSALLVLLFAALPGSWLPALTAQSEYLYLLWSLLAIVLMMACQQRHTVNALYGAAIVVALATLTRTTGIALYAPLLLVLIRAPRRQAAIALLASVLPLLTWYLLHRSRVGYVDALALIYSGDGLSTLRSQLAKELPALRIGFGSNFLLQAQLRPIADVLGALCLAGTAWRMARLKLDAIYIVTNLLILLIWPYPEEAQRFLWVLVPLLIVQPVLAVSSLKGGVTAQAPQLLAAMMTAAILLMILPAFALASDRYRSAAFTDLPNARTFIQWYGEDEERAKALTSIQATLINSMSGITEVVPESDCVIATRPDLINYFGRRRSYFPPLNSVPEPYFGRQLRAPGCHFVFVMSSIDARYAVPMFPMERIEKLDVVFYNNISDNRSGTFKLTSLLVKLN